MIRDQATEDLWFLNGRVTILNASGETQGSSVCEQLLARGDSPPLHVHEREDEIFHVLQGQVRFRVGEREVVAGPGETLVGPKGVPHSFRVESEHARFLVIATGGDFEAMMREMSRAAGPGLPEPVEPTPEMIQALSAACGRHHIALVGPPLAAA